jgi:hypothetical protein
MKIEVIRTLLMECLRTNIILNITTTMKIRKVITILAALLGVTSQATSTNVTSASALKASITSLSSNKIQNKKVLNISSGNTNISNAIIGKNNSIVGINNTL